jgi:hypothetical protein
MKKNTIITVLLFSVAGLAVMTGCENKRKPGKIYMPDMTYSRAIETYVPLDTVFFTTDEKNPKSNRANAKRRILVAQPFNQPINGFFLRFIFSSMSKG